MFLPIPQSFARLYPIEHRGNENKKLYCEYLNNKQLLVYLTRILPVPLHVEHVSSIISTPPGHV